MNTARRLSILVVGASLALAAPAFAAEPTAADSESALQLFKEGKALRETGDQQGALAKLKAAYALVQTPITALELGKTQVALGLLVEAREVLLSVARIPIRTNESTKAGDARVESEALAAELRPRLASLAVRPRGPSDGPPKISVDGVVIPPDAATVPRVVNPGAHVVVVEANGKSVRMDVTLNDGQSRDVEVELPAPAPAPAPAPSREVTPVPVQPASAEPKPVSPLVYAGFGAAIVGVGIGATTGILTLSSASTLKDACRDGRCPASAQSDLDSSSTTGAISTVAFAVGAVGVVVGIVGLVISSGHAAPQRTGLRIVPTGNGVSGSF